MAEFDDYESLPESTSVAIHMTAGAAAGIAEHCAMYPLDSIKTRMQSLQCEKQQLEKGVFKMLRAVMREEGTFRPMRGMSAMALGAGPAHAMYFACYEKLKDKFTSYSTVPEFVCHGIAGSVATLLHDGVMTPAEVVKQRMQMCCSPYSSPLNCAMQVYRCEGFSAFFRSYTTALTMNVPYQATHFMTYEFVMQAFNPDGRYKPSVHFVAGAAAGAVASVITMPLDVCKTLLNTQEPGVLKRLKRSNVVGLFGAASIVYQVKGLPGFFQGLRARVMYQMPATAISWSVYELFKHYLKSNAVSKANSRDYDTLAEYQTTHCDDSSSSSSSPSSSSRNIWDVQKYIQNKTDIVAEVK